MSTVCAPSVPLYQMGGVALRQQLSSGSDGWKEFEEQVLETYGSGHYKIKLRPNLAGVVRAPRVPLYQLGADGWRQHLGQGPQAVAAGGSMIAASLPAIASMAPGLIAVSAIPVVGAAIAVVAAIIAGLWSAHDARAAGAKSENAALNSAVTAFDGSIKAIFQHANSGAIGPSDAITLCQQLQQQYWAGMANYMVGAGRSDCSNHGANCGCSDPYCKNKKCTAGCCAGCFDIMPSIANCITAFSSPTGGTAQILEVYPSKYGTIQRNAYTLTYTPPAPAAAASGVVTGVESAAAAAGLPSWLPLAAGALALLFLVK